MELINPLPTAVRADLNEDMTMQLPRRQLASPAPASATEPALPDLQDFVSLDDSGEFSYHPTAQALLASFDVPAEVVCIVDREGIAHGLRSDQNGRLGLGRALGRVDFHWLRQTWLRTQKLRPQSYPLHRLPPASTFSLLRGMFEALQLEAHPCRYPLPWTVSLPDRVSHPLDLTAVDRLLAEVPDLAQVSVQDPFGHRYAPVRHHTHRFLAPATGYICYVESPNRLE